MKKHHSTASRVIPHHGSPSAALTLVEMLVAMAITLIMMAVVVKLFADIGGGVRIRTATMQMNAQLRSVRGRLSDDLAGATCPPTTWQRQDADVGYIEIVEGQYSDKFPTGLTLDLTTSLVPGSQVPTGNAADVTDARGLGDYDDILALTVRSNDTPFVGRVLNGTVESNLAEIIWYAVENPADGSLGEPGLRTVYRRVLLIAPWLQGALPTPSGTTNAERLQNFYSNHDLSVRIEGGQFVPNTLSDLTKRENRFAHFFVNDPATANGFPHALDQSGIRTTMTFPTGSNSVLHPFGLPFDGTSGERQGEDVMLSDVLAFDLRVYDPEAPIFENAGQVVEPSDPGWDTAPSANLVGKGAYTDLFWNHTSPTWQPITRKTWPLPPGAPVPPFVNMPSSKSQLNFSTSSTLATVTYDTWSYHYETDGLDQNGDGRIDEGADGLDDNGVQGSDDINERETAPPYDTPLRGIQVKLRVYDRDSRQIREATVTREFVPQ